MCINKYISMLDMDVYKIHFILVNIHREKIRLLKFNYLWLGSFPP